jgi:predicted nucleic-acid-binding protein
MSKHATIFFEKVRIGDKRAIILESVLTECVYVLTKFYKIPRQRAVKELIMLFHYKGIINPDADSLIKALQIFSKSSIAIVDCIIITKAEKPNYDIYTYDKKLIKIKNQIDSNI